MARQAFTPPEDDDDILSTLTGAPPTHRSLRQGTQAEPPRDPARPQSAPGERPSPEGALLPTTQTVTAPLPSAPNRPGQATSREPSPTTLTVSGSSRPEPTPSMDMATKKPSIKRIGLYVDESRWLWLKRLSVQRAEKGLPTDFTSIFLEALDEKYRR